MTRFAKFNEMYESDGSVRVPYRAVSEWLSRTAPARLQQKQREADLLFRRIGITFLVYGEGADTERPIPFDFIPRVLGAEEWRHLDAGLCQRVRALNAFLRDLYHDAEILKAGLVPESAVLLNPQFRPEMRGVDLPADVYIPIAGIDVVRIGPDQFFVLEDNVRTPSGVSYMLENRAIMMRLFPDLFAGMKVEPVDHYPSELLQSLRSLAPRHVDDPTVVLLTPGPFNSAYFEHAFLAQQMGIELVEGQDLFVQEESVWMRTTQGPKRVDMIYRRIDDRSLDPLAFDSDSLLGIPGLMSIFRAGGVSLANALGTGVADDKSIYPYVPDFIRFYLGETPIIPNVETYILRRPDDLRYTLDRLDELVVKEVHGSGGYGMLVGPLATTAEREEFRAKILANPGNYIAQPTLALSTCPTYADSGIAPRHLDLRPFVLTGRDGTSVVPGGLTRVALREGSLVVNSSQGGGTKDTWVLEE